jgi:hypothetical protein
VEAVSSEKKTTEAAKKGGQLRSPLFGVESKESTESNGGQRDRADTRVRATGDDMHTAETAAKAAVESQVALLSRCLSLSTFALKRFAGRTDSTDQKGYISPPSSSSSSSSVVAITCPVAGRVKRSSETLKKATRRLRRIAERQIETFHSSPLTTGTLNYYNISY